jgi:hypothetical protein
MVTLATRPPCYCITGHGRSGTSLVAAMLQGGGLDIGQRLMASNEANVRGYFEDMDFYEFHVAVCQSQGFDSRGFILQHSVRVQAQFVEAARAMVEARRRRGRAWGWKEPRTTIFLDFWAALIEELRFLFLFRRPWEVVDSCFRVGDPIYKRNAGLAVRLWVNHNQALLDFLDRFPERCLLVESHAAALAPNQLTEAIAAKFGDYLGPMGQVYEQDLFRCEPSAQQRSVLADYFPEAIELYQQLQSRASLTADSVEATAGVARDQVSLDWGLQFWADLRAEERARRDTCEELKRLKNSFFECQASLSAQQKHLANVEADCSKLRLEAGRTTAEFQQLRLEADRTIAESQQLRLEADRATAESQQLRLEADRATAESQQLRLEADRAMAESQQLRLEADRAMAESQQLRLEADRAMAESQQLRLEADCATAESQQLRLEADCAKVTLGRTQIERDHAEARSSGFETEGHLLRKQLVDLSVDLERVNQALRAYQAQVAWMETSKFWKLRRFWLHLKSSSYELRGHRASGPFPTRDGAPGAEVPGPVPPAGRVRVIPAEIAIPPSHSARFTVRRVDPADAT